MKKIIATVLAMVMALALCTVAFATTTVEGYLKGTASGQTITSGKVTLTFNEAKAPAVTDGKTTAPGNVAYYSISGQDYPGNYVVVGSLAEADVVVYSDDAGKNVMLYLADVNPQYYVAKVFTNFGDKCGQYSKPADFGSTKTYYVAEQNGDDTFYVGSSTGTASVMVDGKLVKVDTVTGMTKVGHVAVPTVKDGKVVGYTCSKCKIAAVEAANYASIPSGADTTGLTGNWYWPVAGTTTTTDTKPSPKTFDAGIAMYVGMALTSVAGSAVVIGKKKEF